MSAPNGPLGCYDDELPDAYHPDIRMEFEWKNRDPVGRPSRGSLFLGNPEARIFEQQPNEAKRGTKTEKGDISIEVRKGTFLKSFDTRVERVIDLAGWGHLR